MSRPRSGNSRSRTQQRTHQDAPPRNISTRTTNAHTRRPKPKRMPKNAISPLNNPVTRQLGQTGGNAGQGGGTASPEQRRRSKWGGGFPPVPNPQAENTTHGIRGTNHGSCGGKRGSKEREGKHANPRKQGENGEKGRRNPRTITSAMSKIPGKTSAFRNGRNKIAKLSSPNSIHHVENPCENKHFWHHGEQTNEPK